MSSWDKTYFLVAVLVYGLAALYSVFAWKRRPQSSNLFHYGSLWIGFAFHSATLLVRGLETNRCPLNNLFEATAFFTWTMAAAYLAAGIWSKWRFLGGYLAPILFGIGVFALMPKLDSPYEEHAVYSHGWSSLHAALILLSYGAFGLGSIAGAMYLTQDYNLKHNKFQAVLSLLPPIQRLDHTTYGLLMGGFIFLSLGLAMSPILLYKSYGVLFKPDPKILWSILVWGFYALLLGYRWWGYHLGRRFAWGAIGAFSFVLLTFWGFNLLSNIHNP